MEVKCILAAVVDETALPTSLQLSAGKPSASSCRGLLGRVRTSLAHRGQEHARPLHGAGHNCQEISTPRSSPQPRANENAKLTSQLPHPRAGTTFRGLYAGLAWAAIIKGPRVGSLNNRHLFSHSSGGWTAEIREPACWFLVKSLFLVCGHLPCHRVLT